MSRGEACSYIAVPSYRKFSGENVGLFHDCIIGNVNMHRCHFHLIIGLDAQLSV